MNQIQVSQLDEYRELLNKSIEEKNISSWKINTFDNKKSNIYLEKNYKIESILNSNREELIFTIYREFEDGIGESSFNLNSNEGIDEFKLQLSEAIFICSQAKSKKYSLPNNKDNSVNDSHINYEDFYSKEFETDFNNNSLSLFLEDKLLILKKLIKENETKEISLKVNYIEFLNSISSRSIETSNNIKKDFKSNSTYFEFVVTAIDNVSKKETEYIVYEKINDIYSFDFESFFRITIESAIKTSMENFAKDFEGIILLKDKATFDFFNPDLTMNSIIGYSSARLKFLEISKYNRGDKMINSVKDKITIYSNPLFKGNAGSSPYDSDGISGNKICLVKDSKFENFFASKQYADYLNIKPTGPFGVIEVLSGKKNISELYDSKDKMLEIISFASFVPDLISGDFSAEIRLGYIHKDGKKIPFKGGLFSGNIFKILEDVELSKETQNVPGYFGPKVLKFYKGNVIGM